MDETYDLIVYSDGSGHDDGYGGWAAIARTPDNVIRLIRMGFIVGTSVDRMEMTAMLEGMQMALEIWSEMPRSKTLIPRRPKVHLFSDRESMVLSIKGVYNRNSAEDLWARFKYYENQMEIHATHVDREVDFPDMQEVDLHASTGRIVAKSYGVIHNFKSYYRPTKHGL